MQVLETSSRSVTVAIIIGAITVGSSIVLASGDAALGAIPIPGLSFDIPATAMVAGLGFMGAVLMGLWLVWNILRRHH